MFVKQIDLNEALKLAARGEEIKVLVSPAPGEGWNSLVPDTLRDMLEDCLFFRDEPVMVKPGFKAAAQEMDDQIPPPVQWPPAEPRNLLVSAGRWIPGR